MCMNQNYTQKLEINTPSIISHHLSHLPTHNKHYNELRPPVKQNPMRYCIHIAHICPEIYINALRSLCLTPNGIPPTNILFGITMPVFEHIYVTPPSGI